MSVLTVVPLLACSRRLLRRPNRRVSVLPTCRLRSLCRNLLSILQVPAQHLLLKSGLTLPHSRLLSLPLRLLMPTLLRNSFDLRRLSQALGSLPWALTRAVAWASTMPTAFSSALPRLSSVEL